jgi:hypothetical protein
MNHAHNTGPTVGPVGDFSFTIFDALPREIRDLLNYAPLNLSTDAIWKVYTEEAWPVYIIVREFKIGLITTVTNHRLTVWGKEYPCHSSYLIESAFKDIPKSPTSGEPHAPAAGAPTRAPKRTPAWRAARTSRRKNHSPST